MPSLGDIVELDATGDVDRHYSFFYPQIPTLSCKCRGRKFKWDPMKCCATLTCLCHRQEESGDDASFTSTEDKHLQTPVSVQNLAKNPNTISAKRSLIGDFSKQFGDLNPSTSLEEILQTMEDKLSSSVVAYGSAIKTVAILKLFGFDSPNQVAETLIATVEIKSAFSKIYKDSIRCVSPINVFEVDIHELDPVSRCSHRKVLEFVIQFALERVSLFTDLAMHLSSVLNVEERSAVFSISRLFDQIDTRNGQVHLDNVFECFEELGLSLCRSSKQCIQCLFGHAEIVRTWAITRADKESEYSNVPIALLTYDTSFAYHFISMEALPMIFLASLSLSSDRTRIHFASLSTNQIICTEENFRSILFEWR